ncbi:MAG: LCP family protein [Candidatus Saccharimonadales bacterium]
MNKDKKLKGPKNRPVSIDGIVAGGRRLGIPISRAYSLKKEQQVSSLGDLTPRADGFHRTRQSSGTLGQIPEAEEDALLDEPIVLDPTDIKKKKRHMFGGHPKVRKALKRSLLSLAALLLIGGGFFGYKFYMAQKNLFRGGGAAPALAECKDLSQLKREGDCRVNVLILGEGGEGHSGADLTDTILLASIDPINNKAALLSIPRDLWVRIPGNGSQKINAAYAYGKQKSTAKNEAGKQEDALDLLDKTLEPVLGIPIHYHAVMDFTAFRQLVNAVGGVTVDVPEQLYDPTIAWENNYNSVIAKKGPQTFNGKTALLYVKSRQTSSDFARAERQRLVLVALKEKTLSLGTFGNPVKITQFLSALGKNIYTDFSLEGITRLYSIMADIPSADISSLDMVKPPNDLLTTANLAGLSIVRPKDGLYDYSSMQNFVRNSLRDSYLAKENSQVAVYNATSTAGLATSKSTELKSFGYNVTAVGNTPTQTNPLKTIVVDLTGGADRYTKHYLQQRFKVATSGQLPSGSGITPPVGTDFVIILGKDVK